MRLFSSKHPISSIYPLSPMQQGMLFHSLCEPAAGIYIEQFSCRIKGRLQIAAFKQAWQQVIDRHGAVVYLVVLFGLSRAPLVPFNDPVLVDQRLNQARAHS